MDDATKLMVGMDIEQPDWWLKYMPEQGWRDLGYAFKAKNYERMEQIKDSWKRSIAMDLMMPVRAAINQGLVKHYKQA